MFKPIFDEQQYKEIAKHNKERLENLRRTSAHNEDEENYGLDALLPRERH